MSFSMYDYIAPPDYVINTVENRPNTMIIVGSMGSGKTTWTLSAISKAIEKLLKRGADDREICVIHTLEYSMHNTIKEIKSNLDIEHAKYMYWFSDDAPAAEGMHGRRSMSKENVSESQFYTVIRHRLERIGFNGFMFIAHATQVYHLIDITFRRTAKLKVFKDYPDEPSDLRIIGPMLGKTYLRKLREISRMIWIPRTKDELTRGLSSAVVRLISKKKVVSVDKKDLPKTIQYLKIKPEGEDRNVESGNRLEYEVLEKGLKPVLRGNTLYIYRRENGKFRPLIKVRLRTSQG